MTLFVLPSKKWGPRTTIFHNVLLFKKIQISLVRGPSQMGQPLVIPKEICTGRMLLKAYTKDRPRISRHFYGDMLPDDAAGSVY
jgi:hypothetical protein